MSICRLLGHLTVGGTTKYNKHSLRLSMANVPIKLVSLIMAIYMQAKAVVKGKPVTQESMIKIVVCSKLKPRIIHLHTRLCFRRVNKEEDGILTAASIAIQDLGYADDVGMIDKDSASASDRSEYLNAHSISA